MANLRDHFFAADARSPFDTGGSGQGRITCKSEWGTDNLGSGDQHRVYKALRPCYVSNFALQADQLDSHVTPTITLDVGTQDDDNEFINASTIAQTGDVTLTNVVDESTVPGFELAADDYIIVSLSAAAATAAAGNTYVSFDVAEIFGA